MNDKLPSIKDRCIVAAILAGATAATLGLLATAFTAYEWNRMKRSTIAEATKRVAIANSRGTEPTSHERVKSLREPIAGWTAEHRVLERRALNVLRQLELVTGVAKQRGLPEAVNPHEEAQQQLKLREQNR